MKIFNLKFFQFVLIGIILAFMVLLLVFSYKEHFPVASVGECILFRSEDGQLMGGIVIKNDIPNGTTSLLMLVPREAFFVGTVDFNNSYIRKYGYIIMECPK